MIGIEMFTNRTSPFKSIFLASYILNIQMVWSCIFFGGGTAHTFTFTHTHTFTHGPTHNHPLAHTQPRPYTHTHTKYTHTGTHTQTHTHSHSHTYAHMRAHTGTHADTRPDAHTHKHTNVRTHIHTQPPCMADCSLPPGKKKPASMVCCAGKYHAYCLPFFQRSPPPPGRSNIATHAHTYTRAQPHAHTLAQTHIHTHTQTYAHIDSHHAWLTVLARPQARRNPERMYVAAVGSAHACCSPFLPRTFPPNCCVRRSVNVPPLV